MNTQKKIAQEQLARILTADMARQQHEGSGYSWLSSPGVKALKEAIEAMPDEEPKPKTREVFEPLSEVYINDGEVRLATILDDVPAWVHDTMTRAHIGEDGKSEGKLVRLANGDLMYTFFPHGDTYLRISDGLKGAI